MKKTSISIIILSVLLALFLSSFIGLSVGEKYAINHYEANYEKTDYGIFTHYEFGCGENDCKYCNGKKAIDSTPHWSDSLAEQFVYYNTINTFKVVSLVGTCVVSAGIIATLAIRYKERIKQFFKKK